MPVAMTFSASLDPRVNARKSAHRPGYESKQSFDRRMLGTATYYDRTNSVARAAMASVNPIVEEEAMHGRDEDGIDRIREPPSELVPILREFTAVCVGEGIDLNSQFEERGMSEGGHRINAGIMLKRNFKAGVRETFKRMHFTEEILNGLALHYGVGQDDPVFGGKVLHEHVQ